MPVNAERAKERSDTGGGGGQTKSRMPLEKERRRRGLLSREEDDFHRRLPTSPALEKTIEEEKTREDKR